MFILGVNDFQLLIRHIEFLDLESIVQYSEELSRIPGPHKY